MSSTQCLLILISEILIFIPNLIIWLNQMIYPWIIPYMCLSIVQCDTFIYYYIKRVYKEVYRQPNVELPHPSSSYIYRYVKNVCRESKQCAKGLDVYWCMTAAEAVPPIPLQLSKTLLESLVGISAIHTSIK